MVTVKCKSCGCSIELEEAYRGVRKGFHCRSCHWRIQWIQCAIAIPLVVLLAAITFFQPGGSEVEGSAKGIHLTYGGEGQNWTISIEPVDWPAGDIDNGLLRDNWRDLLIDGKALVVLLLLDEDSQRAFRLCQEI